MAKNQCLIELQKLKDSALTNGTLSSSEVYDLADLINRRQPRRVSVEWKQEKKAEMREFLEGLEEIFTKLAVTCEDNSLSSLITLLTEDGMCTSWPDVLLCLCECIKNTHIDPCVLSILRTCIYENLLKYFWTCYQDEPKEHSIYTKIIEHMKEKEKQCINLDRKGKRNFYNKVVIPLQARVSQGPLSKLLEQY